MGDNAIQKTITLSVACYRPEECPAPFFRHFEVPFKKEWVVLDALHYIKDQVDATITYRWSCRMGVCGSCGMLLNGVPKLACASYLSDYVPGPIVVEPLSYFPVVRDLVVQFDAFVEKLARVRPWIIREDKASRDEEYLQTPDQVEIYRQYSLCINCALCYAACPVYGLEPDFTGPAAIALAQRYNLDSRDRGSLERMEICNGSGGIWQCTFVGECSEVCPKNVDPSGAIQRYKLDSALAHLKSLLPPWRK